jgi:hypothetical protein
MNYLQSDKRKIRKFKLNYKFKNKERRMWHHPEKDFKIAANMKQLKIMLESQMIFQPAKRNSVVPLNS